MLGVDLSLFRMAKSTPASIPASLFAAGEKGVWYDPSDYSTLFQNAAGTTPVTAVEQPVGKILDKSGRGNHATQTTEGSRPILSARVNLLTHSNGFTSASWAKGANATLTATAAVSPDGSNNAWLYQSTGASDFLYNTASSLAAPFLATIHLKYGGTGRWFLVRAYGTGGANVWVDLLNGSVGTASAYSGVGTIITPTLTPLGDGWHRLQLGCSAGATHQYFQINSVTADLSTVQSNGSAYIYGADLRVTNDGIGVPAYQRIAAATDYDTTGFPLYLRFDGTDDSLATGSIDFTGTDKMTVSLGFRRLDTTLDNFVVLELSTTMGTNPGAFNHYMYGSLIRYGLGGTGTDVYDASPYSPPITLVSVCSYDFAGATIAQEVMPRLNAAVPTLNAASAGPAGAGNFGNYPIYIGARASASNWFKGRIYSLIVRGAASSGGEIAAIEDYVNSKTEAY